MPICIFSRRKFGKLSCVPRKSRGKKHPGSTLGPAPLGQYLRVAEGGVTLPALKISHDQLSPGVDQDTLFIFGEMYKHHLNQLLDAVVNLNFASIQYIWVKLAILIVFLFINITNFSDGFLESILDQFGPKSRV